MQQNDSIEGMGKVAITLDDGREVFVDIPYFKGGKRPPGLIDAIKFARQHPKSKLFVWTGEELRQL